MDKDRKDPNHIDLELPRFEWYMLTAWKNHQNTVYCVDIKLPQQKGLNFNQTRTNVIILYNTLPAYCIPKATKMETGEIKYEKLYASPRPPTKTSFTDNWMQELDSDVAGGSEDSQQIQPKSKTLLSRTVRLVSEQPPGLFT